MKTFGAMHYSILTHRQGQKMMIGASRNLGCVLMTLQLRNNKSLYSVVAKGGEGIKYSCSNILVSFMLVFFDESIYRVRVPSFFLAISIFSLLFRRYARYILASFSRPISRSRICRTDTYHIAMHNCSV